jgi:hypothetical protein
MASSAAEDFALVVVVVLVVVLTVFFSSAAYKVTAEISRMHRLIRFIRVPFREQFRSGGILERSRVVCKSRLAPELT